ncbi:protein kinase domain-containing protein [Couchioplanes azureus]|uniref:protein kinase domain-containing protein n=1 Tax=Couchioplanes caeruleus TaxID=56438 RepID=UPI00166FBE53|nr:AAA family ATPase [Couchioplanes caeruleus]GGQ82210.1 hypothetical protein GCM10010166_60360 [Couchioplanes caeruleus subsp. azureus]
MSSAAPAGSAREAQPGGPAGLEVLGEIGRGSRAVVYRVRRDGAVYAMKALRATAGYDDEAAVALRREVALLAAVDHPGLARVHEVGVADGRPYLLMELVEGQSLAALLGAGPLSEARVIAIGIDVAGALAAAHRAHLVHRDVKPDNIMIAPDGTARLIDFGLATRVADGPEQHVAGTLTYSAPEQSGMLHRAVDGRSDLYSLGAVLFECLTGAAPFVTDDVAELLRRHAVAPVPDPRAVVPALSPALSGIIRRLLAKDPDDRYASGDGLLADLRRAAAEPGTADFPLGTADRPVAPQESPLVGRADELATLSVRWAEAQRGRGGVVLVEGAPGGGKSRLAHELADAAAGDGHLVLRGKSSADDPQPLAPLRSAVDAYVRAVLRLPATEAGPAVRRLQVAAGSTASLVKNLSPALAGALDAADPVGDVGLDRYAAAVAAFLAGLARAAGGAVLHLDDVQWFDEATLRVLDQLAPELATAPLLVVATARDDAASRDAVAEFRARLGDHLDTTLRLEPLDAAAVGRLVSGANGGLRITGEVAARLAARSQGNPFTLLEYVKAIVDAGLARVSWGTWHIDVPRLDDLNLPADTADLVLQRVDALDSGSRRLLGVAAVVGSRFAPGLVADVCGVDARVLADVLADAVRHGLVERRDDGDVAFLHDRIREALLRGAGDAGDRQTLHDRIADALARVAGDDPQQVYALAHHRASGSPGHDPAGRFDACRRAGTLALAEHAPETALFHLETAAAAAARAGIATDADFGELLGVAYHHASRFDEAVETLQETLRDVREPVRRAHLLHQIARVEETRWNNAAQLDANARALEELGRALPRNPVVRALTTLWFFVVGCLIGLTGIGYGTASAARRDRYRLMCLLYESSGAAEIRRLNPSGSLVYALRSPYVANRAGRSPEMARLYSSLGFVARILKLHRLADRLIAVATRTAVELGDRVASGYVAWHESIGTYSSGRDSGESIRRALDEHHRWLDAGLYLDGCAILCWDALLRGDMAEMEPFFARRTTRAVASGQASRSNVVATDAALIALQGRYGEAAARLAGLADDGAATHQRIDRLVAALATTLERPEPGEEFDAAVREFDATGLRPRDLLAMQHSLFVYRAYGELERCRRGGEAERDALLAGARRTIAVLATVPQRPILVAHHRILTAALHEVSGDPAAALAALAAAEPALRAADGPLPAYEAALVQARAYRALGVAGAALRHARFATAIADEQGWAHRSRRVAAEFGTAVSGARTPNRDAVSVSGTRHGQRWAALEQVSLAASRVLDPVKLARIALDETIRILGAERAFLLLLDPATGGLVPHVGRDAAGADLAELTGYSASLVERVRADRQALVVTGSEEGEALGSQSMLVYGLRSILVAPLQLDGRLLGVVYLDSRVAKGVFTADDVDILTAVTHQVAVALETARTAQLELTVEAANRQRDVAEGLRQAMTWLAGTLEPDVVLRRLLVTMTRARGRDRAWLVLGEPAATTVAVLHAADGDGLTETLVTDPGPAVVDLLGVAQATVYPAPPAWSALLTGGTAAAGS